MPNNNHHHHHGHGTSSSTAMAAKRLSGQRELASGQGQAHTRVPSVAGKRKHDETGTGPVAHSPYPHSSSSQNHNNKRRAAATNATNKFPQPPPEEINFAPPAPAPVESGSYTT